MHYQVFVKHHPEEQGFWRKIDQRQAIALEAIGFGDLVHLSEYEPPCPELLRLRSETYDAVCMGLGVEPPEHAIADLEVLWVQAKVWASYGHVCSSYTDEIYNHLVAALRGDKLENYGVCRNA